MRGKALVLGCALLAACASDTEDDTTLAGDTAAVNTDSVPAAPAPDAAGGMLNPDAATREQLAALPGMTPELADSLVARRPFASMLAVDSIVGRSLDETQRDTLYTRLWRPIDPNTASAEEIELIPGVGPRMRGEFEEYRPWTDLAQFRREIGKYVDEAEVARLERYITLR